MDSAIEPRQRPRCEALVLCVSEDVRDLMTYWLASLGIRAVVNPDGADANSLAQDPVCRLLITDQTLPLWPGLSTFLQLRSVNPSLRIAYIADGNVHTAKLATITGATDILSRPLTRKALINALDRVETLS